MNTEKEWEAKVKGILKSELKRRDVTYTELADKLSNIGVRESAENIGNKISRGKFSAIFFMQCLEVIGCQIIRIYE